MYPPSWRKGPAASTGWRLAALALGLAVLAGCGSVTAPGGSAGSGPAGSGSAGSPAAATSAAASASPRSTSSQIPLCASIGQITRLIVIRNHAQNRIQELHFPFPPRVVITNAAAAQSVAKAVCALPRMPKGLLHCPAELLGTSYELTFTAGDRAFPLVTAEATGCEQVTGAGPVRRAATSAWFWQAIGRAMNLVAPGPPVFQGNGPAAAQCGGVGVEPGLARPVGCPAMSGFRK